MFKPSTRPSPRSFSSARSRQVPGFAETQFLHAEDDQDYSGFAPTQMFGDEHDAPRMRERRAVPRDAGDGLAALAEEPARPASWGAARWVDEHDAKAHAAADQARALIAAQRRRGPRSRADAARGRPAGWMRRLRLAVQRVLPFDLPGVLPLFICVSLTMALISAVLPMFDKP